MALTYLYDDSGMQLNKKLSAKDNGYHDMNHEYNGIDNENEVLVREVKEKTNEIFKLRNELHRIQSALKIKESKLNEYKEKMRKVIQQFKTREGELIILNKANEKRLDEVVNSYNEYNSYGNQYEERIMEEEEDNNVIKSLKSLIYDKDNAITELTIQIEKLQKQKQAYYTSPRCYSESTSNNNNSNKVFTDIQNNHKAQLEQKDIVYNELNDKFKSAIKDNEMLMQYTINHIKEIENALDSNDQFQSTEQNFNISHNNYNLNNNKPINSKYDLISKSFDILHKKLTNKLTINSSIVDQYKLIVLEEEEKNKLNQCLIDKLNKEKHIQEEKTNQLQEDIDTKSTAFDEIDKKYNELYSRCKKIEEILNDSNDKYTQFQLETAEFCNSCLKAIHNSLSIDNELLIQGDYNTIKAKEDKILESLLLFCHYIPRFVSNKPSDESDGQQNENERRLMLNLEESNRQLKQCKEEISLIMNKNSRLEHNIALLSQSHSEIEKAIESNTCYYKEVIEDKEIRNDNLIKEIELKDIQIHSLEKLLTEMKKVNPNPNLNLNASSSNTNMLLHSNTNAYQNQMKGRLISKSQMNAIRLKKKQDDHINPNPNPTLTAIFIPNEENEKELKSMFQRFDQESNSHQSEY